MDTFDWPATLRPESAEWTLIVPQSGAASVFDGSQQTQLLAPPRWACTITTGPIRLAEAPRWEATLQRLRGRINRTRLWDWRREAPLGTPAGAPVVAVSALGNTLATAGWLPGVAGVLLAGSWVGINGELKRLSLDANSDNAGAAVLTFEPPLRSAPPVGTALVLTKPTVPCVLTTDRPAMKQQGSRVPSQTLSFEEDHTP